MGRESRAARVLVAADHRRCPGAEVLRHARDLAGADGEVVLASVLVVPVAQPLDASLDRAVGQACAVLDEGEGRLTGARDTRLVRARSFARGILDTLDAERFDLLVLERPSGAPPNGSAQQVETLIEKAPVTVVVIRPAAEAPSRS
jgi:universal stress protein family protein